MTLKQLVAKLIDMELGHGDKPVEVETDLDFREINDITAGENKVIIHT